jgi:hypothetical protein
MVEEHSEVGKEAKPQTAHRLKMNPTAFKTLSLAPQFVMQRVGAVFAPTPARQPSWQNRGINFFIFRTMS